MPLQNRVDPFGAIHAVSERGTLTGNRGIIHDPATRTLLNKRWTTKAWIICLCRFKDRRREVMAHRSWTELFFLDEVTALAAGHRPCFYCQRQRATEFARAFAAGQGLATIRAPEMDEILHRQRLASGASAISVAHDEIADLPDGAMIASGGKSYCIHRGKALGWSFSGYGPTEALTAGQVICLTPAATLAAMRAGFSPVFHPSAPVA